MLYLATLSIILGILTSTLVIYLSGGIYDPSLYAIPLVFLDVLLINLGITKAHAVKVLKGDNVFFCRIICGILFAVSGMLIFVLNILIREI
jgi:hypothetical protein